MNRFRRFQCYRQTHGSFKSRRVEEHLSAAHWLSQWVSLTKTMAHIWQHKYILDKPINHGSTSDLSPFLSLSSYPPPFLSLSIYHDWFFLSTRYCMTSLCILPSNGIDAVYVCVSYRQQVMNKHLTSTTHPLNTRKSTCTSHVQEHL